MAANKVLSLQEEEEVLAEEVRIYPCLFDKKINHTKKRMLCSMRGKQLLRKC